jgi:phosphoacetylglucosamine mutase
MHFNLFRDEDLATVLDEIIKAHKIDLTTPANVYFGRDTRPSSQGLANAVRDGVQAAGGVSKDYGVVSTPQLHYFVVCENTNGAYGVPAIEGYFQKLANAFTTFRGEVNIP